MTQRLARALMVLAPLVAVTTVLSCRGGAATPPPPPPPAISGAVSPSSAAVQTETGLHFTAKVSNSANQNVTWEVNGKAGGDATVGMISSTGLYTAPSYGYRPSDGHRHSRLPIGQGGYAFDSGRPNI